MMQSLKDRISCIYYNYGLFCASHPIAIVIFVLAVAAVAIYPLSTLPLPGHAPLEHSTPLEGYQVPKFKDDVNIPAKTPRWYYKPPSAYIQQVILKTTVSPWQPNNHIQTDAFRGPLSKVYGILEKINYFQYHNGKEKQSIGDVCFHVSETLKLKQVKRLLPEYKCLIVSPGNFWGLDPERFKADSEIMKTLHMKPGNAIETPPTVKDILFGISWKDTGVSRFYIRNRQRVITYAITIILKSYDQKLINSLREKLEEAFPLTAETANNTEVSHIAHQYFKDNSYFVEYIPIIVVYVALFLYLYFSVSKIEMVKSKWGLALSAVATVIGSLLMSVGICVFFGLTPNLNGGEIFPYLVVIIGLENVLVITKSVVSTPVHLDVKIRIAQGLGKEGWNITKNLITELFILFVGFFTFVPAIQEFCLFAVVGLCSDFFLQMVFFATVLSIDIRRMELSDLQHNQSMASLHDVPSGFAIPVNPVRCPVMALSPSMAPNKKSKASLKVQPIEINMDMPTGGAPPSPTLTPEDGSDPTVKKPKRLRLIFFWARTRMVQRAIMVCTVIWITLIVYKSGLVEHIIQISYSSAADNTSILHSTILKFIQQPTLDGLKGEVDAAETVAKFTHKDTLLVKHEDYETWKKLSYMHWPTLFGYYNISLAGRYISILPSIHLSDLINPNDAISLRHPEESKLATLKRELEESDPNSTQGWPTHLNHLNPKRLYPQSQTEAGVTFVLVFTTVVVVTYFMSWLYRCMCSRNYAKWRTSWTRLKRGKRKSSQYVKQIIDTLPLVLEGHKQEVECLVTDGPLIVSACLGGQIRVWDSTSGECLTAIPRKCITPPLRRKPCVGRNINDSDADLYAEYHGSPPTSDITQPQLSTASSMEEIDPFETFNQQSPSIHDDIFEHLPDLSDTIDTDFMSISKNSNSSNRSAHSVDSWTTSAPYQHDSRTKPQQRAGFQKHARNVSWDSGFNKYMAADSSSMDTPSQVKFNIGSAPDYTPHPRDNSQNLRRFSQDSRSGFDFSHFDKYYEDHKELMREKQAYEAHKVALRQRNVGPHGDGKSPQLTSNRKSWHGGEHESLEDYYEESLSDGKSCAAIWCVACTDNLIIAGCGNGRIEFWDGLTGTLKCLYQHNKVGATSICFIANRVIVARLNGGIDFLELETFQKSPVVTMAASASQAPKLHNRGHQRHHSLHLSGAELKCWDDVIHCNLITATRAHQRPINILQSEGGRVVTASEDHTLKVFRLEDSQCLYTLHGHGSSVTALYLDKGAPLAAASGSNDGCVRLWDLLTGACVHKLNAHSTTVNSISCTPVYVISSGQDDRLCIWERCKGLLMYCLQLDAGCCNAVAMMTSNLLVTGGQGCILLWDVSKGEVLRTVNLNSEDSSVFVRWIEVIGNAVVVCGYSHQVQVVHFPSVLEKVD